MQRYRINYHWLIGAFATSVVLAVAAYFVWSWQINRKAGYFLKLAEAALEEAKPQEALESFFKYVQLRPDEEDARIKLGNAAVEVINSGEATFEQLGQALGILDQSVRITDNAELRRKLADIDLTIGRTQNAVDQLELLLADARDDSELKGLLVRALFRNKNFSLCRDKALEFIGYDKKSETFVEENANIEGEPEVYDLLSKVLSQKDGNPELARRVIDQMIVANPDSPIAHLRKSYFHSGLREYQEATTHLDKAYELDPKDAGILLAKARESLGANYQGAKAKYLGAMFDYEEAFALASNRSAAILEKADYAATKEAYLEAITELEKAITGDDETESAYEAAKVAYEAAAAQLVPSSSARQNNSRSMRYTEASEKFLESKSDFEAAFPVPEEAQSYIAAGLEEHPENVVFYRLMAGAQQQLEQNDAALEVVNKGIEKLGNLQAIDLILYKIDLLFAKQDYAGVQREIERLEDTKRQDIVAVIDLQKARILFRQKRWPEATKELKRIRPLLFEASRSNFQAMAGAMLGVSYESQGIYDLARQAYETVLNDHPNNEAARQGLARINDRLKPLEISDAVELDQVIDKTLELPDAEQDWSQVEELIKKVIVDNGLSPPRQKLLHAKVNIKRGNFKLAKDLIRQAAQEAPDDINIHFAAILLVASDPQQGPASALKLLDRLERRWGRSLQSRAQRADLLVILNPDDVGEQLRLLLTDTDDLSEAELLQLNKALGVKFEQIGQFDDARALFEKSVALEPNNLPLRMYLFELALRQRDDAAMQKAQESILDFVKSKDNANYLLTEVKRRIANFDRGRIDQGELNDCRQMLDAALVQRPNWHELHITYGQLLLILEDDIELALQYFDNALKYGPPKSNAVAIQIKLLAERGLYDQARERMERLRKDIRGRVLGQLEAEILVATGDPEGGFAAAEKLAKAKGNDPATQLWFSKIAQDLGKLDVAVTALRQSLDQNPSNPEQWLRLIGLLIQQNDVESIEGVLREAHLACEADALSLLTAKKYEMSSQWQMAEDIYLAAYAGQLDELHVLRRLGDFYLLWSKKDAANVGKAAVYINRILRAANEGRAPANHPHVVWARQQAAKILFAKNDYRESLKAERLLRQSAVNGIMNNQESELLTDILISRRDPASLKKAVALLTQQREAGRLGKKGALQLARILIKSDRWEESNSLMLELISKYPSDQQVRGTYIDLLIDQGEFSRAETAMKRLRSMGPVDTTLVQRTVRLAALQGKTDELNQMLKSLLPKKMGGALSSSQLQTVLSVAQLATRYEAYELAGQLYETYARRVPADSFKLANFLAYHGDCDRAIELMKRLYPEQTDDVVQLANLMIKARRDEVGDKYDEQVDRMINAALREDPDSISRQIARAEAYDTQGKYQESVAAYEKLLERVDVPDRMRAAAMNNLGFQLGLLNERVDEAEKMINEAMETFGPVEDMLDTRAVVRIAQGKYDLAIEDMELALSVSRDPVKYFHLAKAYILAGDGLAATKAWQKAQELGFEKDSLPTLEKSDFEQILQKIESFQGQNAKL